MKFPKPIKQTKPKRTWPTRRRRPIRNKMTHEKMCDHVFGVYMKCKARWHCQVCPDGVYPPEELGYDDFYVHHIVERIDISHFYNRHHRSVRHDEDNVDVLCSRHHAEFEHAKNPGQAYYEIKLGRLGADKFADLSQRKGYIQKTSSNYYVDLTNTFIDKINAMGLKTAWLREKYKDFL